MKNIGIDCQVPPNLLRNGFGKPICTVLLLLCDKALEVKTFAFKPTKIEEKQNKNIQLTVEELKFLYEIDSKTGKVVSSLDLYDVFKKIDKESYQSIRFTYNTILTISNLNCNV